jgi:hypothetical protein
VATSIEAEVEVRKVTDDSLYGFIRVGPVDHPDMATTLTFSREGRDIIIGRARDTRSPGSSEWDAAELALRRKLEAAAYQFDRLVRRV